MTLPSLSLLRAPGIEDQLRDFITTWLSSHGLATWIPIACFVLAVLFGWSVISKMPGVPWLLGLLPKGMKWIRSRQRPPRVDDASFSIVVTRLDGDNEDRIRRQVAAALQSHFRKDEVCLVMPDVSIDVVGYLPQRVIEAGHSRARFVLEESGANIAIWGQVLADDVVRLHWTVGDSISVKSVDKYEITDADLPDLFWRDLEDVLGLLAVSQFSALDESSGSLVVDQLVGLISRVDRLLAGGAITAPDKRTALQLTVAGALTILGGQTGDPKELASAVARYRMILVEASSNEDARTGAEIRSGLGRALWAHSSFETGTKNLEEAVSILRSALILQAQDIDPIAWARSQHYLANALWTLGELTGNNAWLLEAKEAIQAALSVRTRSDQPVAWAKSKVCEAIVLAQLGTHAAEASWLEASVAAYREALEVITRDTAPVLWASTMNNLGHSLVALGIRQSTCKTLGEAINILRSAKAARDKRINLRDWAQTQANLAQALTKYGERQSDPKSLNEGIAAYREVLSIPDALRPLQAISSRANLAGALLRLSERSPANKLELLSEAVDLFTCAARELSPHSQPILWASASEGLAVSLIRKAEDECDTGLVGEAITVFKRALREVRPESQPRLWGGLMLGLGAALLTLGRFTSNQKQFHEAIRVLTDLAAARGKAVAPLEWAGCQRNLAICERELAVLENDWNRLRASVSACLLALEVYEQGDMPNEVVATRAQLREVQALQQQVWQQGNP